MSSRKQDFGDRNFLNKMIIIFFYDVGIPTIVELMVLANFKKKKRNGVKRNFLFVGEQSSFEIIFILKRHGIETFSTFIEAILFPCFKEKKKNG